MFTLDIPASQGKQGTWSMQKAYGDQLPNKTGTTRHVIVFIPVAAGITANRAVAA
jgi:hypothetical protein